MVSQTDLGYLHECLQLAAKALDEGSAPFGSLLVSGAGEVIFADHNRDRDGDSTAHPEFAVARWAARHLDPAERATATVYTSGEHCPMCSAAHGAVGLGRIVYAVSSAQLVAWRTEWGSPPSSVAALPITTVVPSAQVDGPAVELYDEIKSLHRAAFERMAPKPEGGR